MSKLKGDRVDFKVGIEADDAQNKIHNLTKNIEQLRKQNQEHPKEVSRLASAEGDNSKEIARLNDAIRQNTKEIERNQREIRKEEKELDLTTKSAAQLKKELRNLKKELANTSKSLHPEKWRDTEKAIAKYETGLKKAEAPTKNLSTWLKSLPSISTIGKGALMSLGAVISSQVIGAFKNYSTPQFQTDRRCFSVNEEQVMRT